MGGGYDPRTHLSCVSQFGLTKRNFLFNVLSVTDSFILGSDKYIHDRDMAWLVKSDGKLEYSLCKLTFLASCQASFFLILSLLTFLNGVYLIPLFYLLFVVKLWWLRLPSLPWELVMR